MSSKIKWIFLIFIIILLILIPFFIFNYTIENWTNYFLNSSPPKLLLSIVIGGLLAIDIIAPVPSSIISTASGYFLGSKFDNPISKKNLLVNLKFQRA